MILFNLVLNQQLNVDSHKDFYFLKVSKENIQDNLVSTTYKHKYNYDRKIHSSILLLAKNNTKQIFNQHNFINENVWNKLFAKSFLSYFIKKYWQETMFISVSHSPVQIQFNQAKANQMSLNSSDYKNLLLDFSKALMKERIQVSMQSDCNSMNIQPNIYDLDYSALEVVWKKGLNIVEFKDILLYIKNHLFNINKLKTIKYMNCKPLPLFTIVNDFNQIVLAEPSQTMLVSNNIVDYISKMYGIFIKSRYSMNNKYLALFFLNPKDATEYSESIKYKYRHLTSQSTQLFPTTLDLYYKLSQTRNKHIDFRLIPDLEEVNKVINKYQYYKNTSFCEQQNYGKNFFQGQPIYIIKPVMAINKISKQKSVLHYSYNTFFNKKEIEYSAVFLNYDTALHAWSKFKKQMKNYRLSNKPQVDIHNLESFIKICEQDKKVSKKNIIFIPSHTSYQYIKSSMKLTSQLNIFQKFINRYVYVKIITQRILWSLTSRQPIQW